MTVPSRLLERADVSLAYQVTGIGSPVICIQGVGVVGRGWQPQVAGLPDRFRLITFDNRGIGQSSRGSGALSVPGMAADVWALADAGGDARCHLVGHSLGGLVALEAALAAPARVKSLSLLCTFADGAGPTRFRLRMALLGARSRIGTATMRRRAMLEMLFGPEWLKGQPRAELAERLAALFGRDLADSPPIIDEQLHIMARHDVTSRLATLAGIPTLVISGRHDPIAPPAFGQTIAGGIPGARFVEFADASHALTVQCADRVNALLSEHLTLAD
jgi:pimeloyl-ACP methyl ester carboxylesterase